MYQQQTQHPTTPKTLPPQQLLTLLTSCQYISHIIYPHQHEQLLQDPHTHSLMHIPQQLNNPIHTELELEIYQQHLVEYVIDFRRICVELFYFMFACMSKKYCLEFYEELFVFCGIRERFMIVVKDVGIQEQDQREMVEDDRYYSGRYMKVVQSLIVVLRQSLEYLDKRIQDFKKMGGENIQNQIKEKQNKIVTLALKPLQNYYTDIETINKKILSDYKSFIQLQKSQFLTNNSILYKIRNRSINIYLYKHSKPQSRQKLFNAIKNQKKLIKEYQNAKILFNTNKQQLNDLWRRINVNFQKYVQDGWSGNPMYIKVVPSAQQNNQEKQKANTNGQASYVFKLKLKPITQKLQQKQPPPPTTTTTNPKPQQHLLQKQQILQYSIQYFPNRPSFIIKLHTPLTLQPSNSDQLLHNWNSLTYQTPYTSIQLGQKMQPNTKIRRYIIIKSICQFRIGDSVLCQFFRLIDITMMGYKIIQQIVGDIGEDVLLNQYRFNDVKDVNREIKHYVGIVGELARRLYAAV